MFHSRRLKNCIKHIHEKNFLIPRLKNFLEKIVIHQRTLKLFNGYRNV